MILDYESTTHTTRRKTKAGQHNEVTEEEFTQHQFLLLMPGDIFELWDPEGHFIGRFLAFSVPWENEDVPGHWSLHALRGIKHIDGKWHYEE